MTPILHILLALSLAAPRPPQPTSLPYHIARHKPPHVYIESTGHIVRCYGKPRMVREIRTDKATRKQVLVFWTEVEQCVGRVMPVILRPED